MALGTTSINRLLVFALSLPMVLTIFASEQNKLDKIYFQKLYRNGEFETVIRDLEHVQKQKKKLTLGDSLFVEKYLAVVYAANPGTRELGRYHMHKMLDLSPTVDLIDMFVGDEVDKIFEKVRKEHVITNSEPSPSVSPKKTQVTKQVQTLNPKPVLNPGLKPAPKPVPKATPSPILRPQSDSNPNSKPVTNPKQDLIVKSVASDTNSNQDARLWIGGGAVLALVAITLYFSGSPKENTSKTYFVPENAVQ